ncbi:MAG TPA: protein kinase [Chlamydiales bacterium]|nr:protein kinase [Chlamydiales bacterium]
MIIKSNNNVDYEPQVLPKLESVSSEYKMHFTAPIDPKMIDSGTIKMVFIDQSPLGRSDLVYYIAKNKLLNTRELRKEAQDGISIKNSVYLTNLQIFLESIGHTRLMAKSFAENLILQFPNPEDLVASLQKKDARLQAYFNYSQRKIGENNPELQRLLDSSLHLAVNYAFAPHISLHGQSPVITKRADTNLDKKIRQQKYPFKQSLELALQVLKGFRDLHAAHYVHGDPKPENLLVYNNGENPIVKIADWGKCKKMRDEDTAYYLGNHRFMPPERLNSQTGEVFGIGMVLVRILEEEFLDTPHAMLIAPDRQRKAVKHPLKGETNEMKARKGIERFVVLSKDFPSQDYHDAFKHTYGSFTTWALGSHKNTDPHVHKYLYTLQERLNAKYGNTQMKKKAIEGIIQVLSDMMHSNVDDRISMEEAVPRFETLIRSFH